MSIKLLEDLFFEYFFPGVARYLKTHNLPIKDALLVDNTPTYPAADINLMFLPRNVTAFVQPIHQGVLLL